MACGISIYKVIKMEEVRECSIYEIENNLFNLMTKSDNDYVYCSETLGEFETFKEASVFFDNGNYKTGVLNLIGDGTDDVKHDRTIKAYFLIELVYNDYIDEWEFSQVHQQSKVEYHLYLLSRNKSVDSVATLENFGAYDKYTKVRERLRYFFICEQDERLLDGDMFDYFLLYCGDCCNIVNLNIRIDYSVFSPIRIFDEKNIIS